MLNSTSQFQHPDEVEACASMSHNSPDSSIGSDSKSAIDGGRHPKTCRVDNCSEHLLSALNSKLSADRDKCDPSEQRLMVKLLDVDLWTKFARFTNEMIVTKNGRYVLLYITASELVFLLYFHVTVSNIFVSTFFITCRLFINVCIKSDLYSGVKNGAFANDDLDSSNYVIRV